MSYTGLPPYMLTGIDINQTIFAGMTQAQLQAAYTSLIAAQVSLAGGNQVAQASYMQGDGQRQVTFRKADMAALQGYLMILMRALGLGGPSRRPMQPIF